MESHWLRSNTAFLTEKGRREVYSCLILAGGRLLSINNTFLCFSRMPGTRVILDIRLAPVSRAFCIQNRQKVNNFLAGNSKTGKYHCISIRECWSMLSVVPSGPVPPNPAELFGRERLKDAFTYFRKYFRLYHCRLSAPASSQCSPRLKQSDGFHYAFVAQYTYRCIAQL